MVERTLVIGLLGVAPVLCAGDFQCPQVSDDVFELAKSGKELDTVIWTMVRELPDSELLHRRESTDDSIALAMAWEGVGRTMAAPVLIPDREALCRFVGFVEGRLGGSLPQWWEAGVIRAKGTPQRLIIFEENERESPYRKSPFRFYLRDSKRVVRGDDRYGLLAAMVSPTDASISELGEGWRIDVADESLVITESVRECFGATFEQAYVHFGRSRVYIAFHTHLCIPYRLFCLDRENGQIIWKCRVWANGGLYDHSGGGQYHWIAVRETAREVLVFGLASGNAYIEGFRRQDGKCTFRFGTAYGSWARLAAGK